MFDLGEPLFDLALLESIRSGMDWRATSFLFDIKTQLDHFYLTVSANLAAALLSNEYPTVSISRLKQISSSTTDIISNQDQE